MNTNHTRDLGHGFRDHGVATAISNHRGTVATVDAEGRPIVLVWLFDHRGGYALLLIDAVTGRSEEFPTPFPLGGDCPYSSILSTRNRYYTHFNGHFAEFDPVRRAFSFWGKTAPNMAMSMTEDTHGRIWLASYPDSGVVCFDPQTASLRDYGHVYKQNWPQYQRSIATDDAGWVYFAVGNTLSQIVALHGETGKVAPLLDEPQRSQGTAYVYAALDGRVYGQALHKRDQPWLELYEGRCRSVPVASVASPRRCVAGSQGLFHDEFPDGRKLLACDLVERVLTTQDPKSGQITRVTFDYESEGAHLMGLIAAPDGTICGGTAFPMRFFSYNPKTDAWVNRACLGQWNTLAVQGERVYVGAYTEGLLLEWDPAKPWVPTQRDKPEGNPRFLTQCEPTINRPHCLLAHPDGRTVILAGTPGYGYTGGGLLFWDRVTGERTLLEHGVILPEHSTASLVALADGKLLGGSTIAPGTGGEFKAKLAELYVMDMATHRIEWHEPLIPDAQGYTSMCLGSDGLVYGLVDARRFFVFDPVSRSILHEHDTLDEFGAAGYQQGARKVLLGEDGRIYLLFNKGIARVVPRTFELSLLAQSPVPVGPGGDILDGRLYFASGARLYSYDIRQ